MAHRTIDFGSRRGPNIPPPTPPHGRTARTPFPTHPDKHSRTQRTSELNASRSKRLQNILALRDLIGQNPLLRYSETRLIDGGRIVRRPFGCRDGRTDGQAGPRTDPELTVSQSVRRAGRQTSMYSRATGFGCPASGMSDRTDGVFDFN